VATLVDRLSNAMNKSGYKVDASDAKLAPIMSKLQYLSGKARFGKLLRDLFACNDNSNLHSLLFEVIFAWHFEIKCKHLVYEKAQQQPNRTTIDFLYEYSQDTHIYYELRVVQEQAKITEQIEDQLRNSKEFKLVLNGGSYDQNEVIRLQQILLNKVQDREGTPVKFFSTTLPNYNILVVDVSQPLLGSIDRYDCLLCCYGDEAVSQVYRRGVFGLFQSPGKSDPGCFDHIYNKFNHIRTMIHGILFMRRQPKSNPINYDLQYYFVPNRHILSEKLYNIILAIANEVFGPWQE